MSTLNFTTTVTLDGAQSISGSQAEVGGVAAVVEKSFSANTANGPIDVAFNLATVQGYTFLADQNATLSVNGTNEVQQIAITGAPTSGTFTLTLSGHTTGSIAWNATAAIVQAALEATSGIGVGAVACTGGPLPGTPVLVTFGGSYGLQNVPAMTATDSYVGGSAPATVITTPTAGVAPDQTLSLKAGNPLNWGKSGYYANLITFNVVRLALSCTTATRFKARIVTP